MSDKYSRNAEVSIVLRHLEQYSTVSPFSRLFYRLIYDLLDTSDLDADKVRQAFMLFLRCECRKHQAVSRIVRAGEMDLLEILNIGRAAQRVLTRVCGALASMSPTDRREQILQTLVLAECYYHLGRTPDVIRALRCAIELGYRHPLVHFALGYNLYASALKRFTRSGSSKGEVVPVDEPAFVGTCRAALGAFRDGLGHEGFDAQLYWWIGVVWETLGKRADARRAYRRAMDADPEHFTDKAQTKLRVLRPTVAFDREPEEAVRLSQLGPITEDDIEAARRTLGERGVSPDTFLE